VTGRPRRRAIQEVTIAHVAKRAGVSGMTVSRTLSGRAPVGAATRERVLRAIRELRYQPNPAARHLAGGRAPRFGLLYVNPSPAYLSELLVGALTQEGLQLALAGAADATGRRREVRAMIRSGVHAFLLPPSVCDDPKLLALLRESGVRWVAVSPAEPADHALCVYVNDYEAARTMTARLVALGHHRIGFIVGDLAYRAAIDRREGYLRAMADAGLAPGPLVRGRFSFRSSVAASERLLDARPRCTAIFASNDDMAAGALAAAHRRGLRVPGDVSIVGFDDSPIAATMSPAITTVRQPIAAMARAAVELLAQAVEAREREAAPVHQRFDCALVERESSGPAASQR